MQMNMLQRHIRPRLSFYLYLPLISAAEFVTAAVDARAGLIMHFALLVALLAHAGLGRAPERRRLALALTLAPLTRVLSLALPLTHVPQLAWYPFVAAPLLLAAWMIARQVGVSRRDLGLRLGALPLQLALVSGGLGLGALEYLIIRPPLLVAGSSWPMLLIASVVLLVCTGFTEELIFRGLLQRLAAPVLGPASLAYVAVLFGVMHIGYLSVVEVVFVALVGALFGRVVGWSGSILGVTLAHGVGNITLFLLIPYVVGHSSGDLSVGIVGLALVGALGFAIVYGVLAWQARNAAGLEARHTPRGKSKEVWRNGTTLQE